jgi:hypothetical protein
MKKLLLFLLILPAYVFAQDTISGSVAAGGQVLSGNFNSYTVNANTDWRGRHLKSDWDIAPSFRYTNNSGTLKEREVYATESYFYRFTPHFKVLVFSEQEHSWLRKTLFRGNLGVGISYRFIHTKVLSIEGSEAILPDFYFSITNRKRDNFAIRPSTRLKIRVEYYPLRFETINMVQPEALGWGLTGHYNIIDQKSNINFRSTTTLDVAIKKGFSIGARLDFIYQTYPHLVDAKIQPYDLTFVFYLKYQLHDLIPMHPKKSE